MTDTIHHVDCEKKTFFAAALILRGFAYCAFTRDHEAQVQAHHGVSMNGGSDEIQMTDTTHHVDCEKTTFFEAVLILSSFVYCAFTCEHEAQVQAHHGVLINGLMKHK